MTVQKLCCRYLYRYISLNVVFALVCGLILWMFLNSRLQPLPTAKLHTDPEFANVFTIYDDFNVSHQFAFQSMTNLKCTENRRPVASKILIRNEYWHVYEQNDDMIAAYSAYYDDRPILNVETWLRILVIAKVQHHSVFCHIWYDDVAFPYVVVAGIDLTGRRDGYRINNETMKQYLYSCRLPSSDPRPTHVTLTTAHPCGQSSIYLPIQRPIRAEPEHEFGACVAIAFGTVPVPVFVEWLELNRLFGITEFNVYDAGMTNMTEVFEYYVKLGLLRVHRMPPAIDSTSYDAVKLSSPASLNDCMLKNAYRYQYVVVIDFDEYIVPRQHRNYHEMIDAIDKNAGITSRHKTYSFSNAFYFLEFQPDATQPSYLRSATYRRRASPNTSGVAPKSFVDPRCCLSVFNHYCWIPFKSAPKQSLIRVNTSVAMTHHYRRCQLKKTTCTEYYQQETVDDAALRFKDQLKPEVDKALAALGLEHLLVST